jgi:hypothetical protein
MQISKYSVDVIGFKIKVVKCDRRSFYVTVNNTAIECHDTLRRAIEVANIYAKLCKEDLEIRQAYALQ